MHWCRAPLALGLLIAALCAAGASTAHAQDVACDPGDREVRRLTFDGNRAFSDAELATGLVTTPSTWARRVFRIIGTRRCLDPIEVRRDSLRLIYFYRRHGFPQVEVGMVVDSVGRDGVEVGFSLKEGAPVLIDSLTISGLDSVPNRERLLRGLPVRVGGRFDQYAVEAARDTILRRLRNSGYPESDVLRSFSSDTAKLTATLTFDVLTGPRARLGAIHLAITPREGKDQRVSDAAVRRALGVEPGDLYRERDLETAKRSLYLSDAYRHVSVVADTASLAEEGDSTIDIRITLAENQMRSARASGGWGTLDCFRAQGEVADYGFLGGLRRVDLSVRVSKIGVGEPLDQASRLCASQVKDDPYSDTLNYYAGATLRQSALFGLRTVPTITVYSERRSEYLAFRRYTPIGAIVSLNHQVRPTLATTYAYQLEFGRTSAQPAIFCAVFLVCEASEQSFLSDMRRLATASVSLVRNRANDPFNPTRGSVMGLELRHASPVVGSDPRLRFNKAVADASWYWGIGDGAVLVARLRGGLVFGKELSLESPTEFIPQQERLYAGGPNTVRGFRQNELGPAVYIPESYQVCATPGLPCVEPVPGADTVYFNAVPGATSFRAIPLGGNSVVVGNVELRLRSPFLPSLVQWALFTDAGEVWTRGGSGAQQGFQELRITPGLGVRVASPVGPIRVDLGYNPYQRPRGAAYFDAPVGPGGTAPLYCVSPGNGLPVTGYSPDSEAVEPPQQAQGPCGPTYEPRSTGGFFRRLTFNISIGQAF
jgi:outer membrane protein insertion porin family/translocation and assembly module TamA